MHLCVQTHVVFTQPSSLLTTGQPPHGLSPVIMAAEHTLKLLL